MPRRIAVRRTVWVTDAEVLEDLRRASRDLGRYPQGPTDLGYELDEEAIISRKKVMDVFGSWNRALALAGLKLNKRSPGRERAA